MGDRGCTSAWRRGQQRLRAQWRHGQQTDAMAVAAALGHNAGLEMEMLQHAYALNTSARRGRPGLRAGPHRAQKRRHLFPRCWRAFRWSPRRRGVTALCGTPLGEGLSTLALPSLAGQGKRGRQRDGAPLPSPARSGGEGREGCQGSGGQEGGRGEGGSQGEAGAAEEAEEGVPEIVQLQRSLSCSGNSPPLWTPWILRPLLGRERKERRGGRGRRDAPCTVPSRLPSCPSTPMRMPWPGRESERCFSGRAVHLVVRPGEEVLSCQGSRRLRGHHGVSHGHLI